MKFPLQIKSVLSLRLTLHAGVVPILQYVVDLHVIRDLATSKTGQIYIQEREFQRVMGRGDYPPSAGLILWIEEWEIGRRDDTVNVSDNPSADIWENRKRGMLLKIYISLSRIHFIEKNARLMDNRALKPFFGSEKSEKQWMRSIFPVLVMLLGATSLQNLPSRLDFSVPPSLISTYSFSQLKSVLLVISRRKLEQLDSIHFVSTVGKLT